MTVGERVVSRLWAMRWVLLALLVPVVGLALWAASGVGTDNAVHVWFVEGDPALEAYDRFQEAYGNDEVVILAVHEEDGLLTESGIARLRAVSDVALATEGIADVVSLTTLTHVRIPEDWVGSELEAPPIAVEPVVGEWPGGDVLGRRVLEDPLLRGKLLSEDGTTALVLAQMEPQQNMDAVRDGILADLMQRVEQAAGEVPAAGTGVIFSGLNQASSRDTVLLGGVSYLLILVLLWLLLGRVGSVVLAMAAVGTAAVLPIGMLGLIGRDLNMVTMALPTLVLIIGVADCVHLLHSMAHRTESERSTRVVAGVSRVLWPCLFTTLTTSAGFLALVTARMPVVRDLGWFASTGVLGAFVVAVIFVLVGGSWSSVDPKPARTRWLEVLLQRTADLAISRRRGVLWGAVFMILVGAFGISRIDADTYSIDYFRDSHPVRQDSEFIEEHFGPYTPLEFVVEVPEGGRSVALLGAIASWQDAMERDPDVGWTRSAVDVVRRLHQLLTDGRPESYVVPATDKGLEEALWVYQSDPDADLSDSVDSDWSRIRVTAGTRMMSARDIGEAIDRLVALADLPTDARIVPSGYVPLYVTMMDYVVRSQITSFAAAFVIIFALLALMYRSLRMAVLAVPANLFPLFLTLGLMGLAGIRLDVATVTIAAIVLGLVVDDTTHFLYRFRESLRVSGDHEAAVRESLRTTGVAMATTSIVLVAGFSVLVLATVKSVAAFGLLIAVALASALLGDLVVLPALLVTLRPRL